MIYKDWSREEMGSPPVFRGTRITPLLTSVLCCVSINFVCLCPMCCVLNVASLVAPAVLFLWKTQTTTHRAYDILNNIKSLLVYVQCRIRTHLSYQFMILMFARYEISLIVSLVYYNVIGVKSKLIFFFFSMCTC